MGRKINPKIFRIPLIRDWESKWFAEGPKFRQFLKEDLQIRRFLAKKFKNCGISNINIERLANTIRVIIQTAKTGLIIGRGGFDIEKVKDECERLKKEKDLTSFGEGQLHLVNILIDIIDKWKKERGDSAPME
ncbi:KH domain-containing protein [Patescibacteria group bacterium]|nr:KH domain-containing protein [Patescibacteria group bacterium]